MSFFVFFNITKRFDSQTALNNVSASFEKGEFVCILGPSGCGKTTLLRVIGGLETAAGSVFIDGRDCTGLPSSKRNFGIMFQSYALFPNMTVMGNVLFGLRQKRGMTRDEMESRAMDVLCLVDLTEHKNKYPRQLSGGQQQRTALARAIVLSPSFLLLDEPLSALDAKVRAKLRVEIRAVQRKLGITTIMVTHDQEEALTMADRIIVMNKAVIEQTGTPREIYYNPATPFVANFIGTMNFYREEKSLFAIRPERIEIVRDARKSYDVSAHVTRLEFKGPLTRIHGVMPERTEICVDVPSENFDRMGLNENGTMFLRMPTEHLTRYSECAAEY
jgi:iron(III) transport system ATP-binding protein